MLEPYRVGVDGPWTRKQAGHLLRRAGFCAGPDEVAAALRDGLPTTVERLVGDGGESRRFAELDGLGEAIAATGGIARLAGWWLSCMAHTRRPLAARLSVLWHNHFATGNQKVESPALMLQQLRLFQRHALGDFQELLLEVSRDPAMIVWLDGDSNRRDHPNENYARELFELFVLGPGNYSESDIREAARAFSGWHQRRGRFAFNARLHDDGPKTIFGRTGDFDGADVVRMAVEHAACALFMARKLAREFLADEPDGALVTALADELRAGAFHVKRVIQKLLQSRAFFAERYYRARIKSPVEFVIGLVRSFEMRAPAERLQAATARMGQRLFEPPSVKGWEGQRRWINSSTMLVRMNAATAASAGWEDKGLRADEWLRRAGLGSAREAVDFALDVMLDGEVEAKMRAALRRECDGAPDEALRAAVAAIGASPLYQLG